MARPEEIASNIRSALFDKHGFVASQLWAKQGVIEDMNALVSEAILSAVKEEREACARIAQQYDGLGRYPSEGAAYGDASLTQLDIAEAIRNREGD